MVGHKINESPFIEGRDSPNGVAEQNDRPYPDIKIQRRTNHWKATHLRRMVRNHRRTAEHAVKLVWWGWESVRRMRASPARARPYAPSKPDTGKHTSQPLLSHLEPPEAGA